MVLGMQDWRGRADVAVSTGWSKVTFAQGLESSEGINHVAMWGKCGPEKESCWHVRGTVRQQVCLGPGNRGNCKCDGG